jgi:uncharacterized protein (TIGR02145 family)
MKRTFIKSIMFAAVILCALLIISCKKQGSSLEVQPLPVHLGDDDAPLPYENTSWMANIDDSRYLYEFTIPGTHDCAADEHTSQVSAIPDPIVVCQDFYISNQMNLGIRWFDVRLRLNDGNLLSYHGPYYLHKNFNDLLQAALDFLQAHPTETIIFMIKQENSTASDDVFGQKVLDYLHGKSPDLSKFYTGLVNFPMMGDVRGKIVIFSRYKVDNGNIFSGIYVNWDDNTKGENVDNCGYPLWVQDHYSMVTVPMDTKCDEIKSGIGFAQNAHNNRLYLNFTSGEADPVPIHFISDYVNSDIDNYLAENPAWNQLGVVFVNFAGGRDETDGNGNRLGTPMLVQHLIDHSNYTREEVKIGSQVWLKKNLSTSFYSNGDLIPNVTSNLQWIQLKTGAWRTYDDGPPAWNWLGKLYNYSAIHDPRGICPKGYHVPTDSEWSTLFTYLGGSEVAGGKMKDTLDGLYNMTWKPPNTGATNSSGFTACGTGVWYYGGFYSLFEVAGFWGKDASNNTASSYALSNTSAAVVHYADTTTGIYGLSVRCIKN